MNVLVVMSELPYVQIAFFDTPDNLKSSLLRLIAEVEFQFLDKIWLVTKLIHNTPFNSQRSAIFGNLAQLL